MSNLAKTIRIIVLPHGEAPVEVREGWIGCVLRCDPECGHTLTYASGVVTGETHGKVDGYSVNQKDALAVLMCSAPFAAAWFYEHGFPRENQRFRFMHEEAEVIETYTDEELASLGPIHIHDDMETGTMRHIS